MEDTKHKPAANGPHSVNILTEEYTVCPKKNVTLTKMRIKSLLIVIKAKLLMKQIVNNVG